MKRKTLILIAALLTLALAAGCGRVIVEVPGEAAYVLLGGRQAETPATAAPTPDTPTVTDAAVTTAAAEPSGADSTEPVATTAAQTPATTAASTPGTTAAQTPATTAAPANSAPSTKDEVVSYYVTAYNKIATDAKSVTRTYDYTRNYNNIVEVGGNERLAGLAQTLMNQFMKENSEQVPGDASSLPPIGVTKLSISPSQVSSATCTDKGSTYEIVLKSTGTDSNYEIDATPGQGSAGVIGPLLRTEDVSGAAGSLIKFEGLHAYYPTGTVTATVDKASGHITELKFDVPCILHFDKVTAFVVVTVQNTDLGLEFLQNWSITY